MRVPDAVIHLHTDYALNEASAWRSRSAKILLALTYSIVNVAASASLSVQLNLCGGFDRLSKVYIFLLDIMSMISAVFIRN